MSEVDLTFTFALTEAPIQEPRGVDQEGLFAEPACIEVCWRVHCIIGIGFEAHGGSKEGRVDVGC